MRARNPNSARPPYPVAAGPVPTVTPDATRCRHRNDPQTCGECNPVAQPAPPPPNLRADLPPPRPGRRGQSYAPKAAS